MTCLVHEVYIFLILGNVLLKAKEKTTSSYYLCINERHTTMRLLSTFLFFSLSCHIQARTKQRMCFFDFDKYFFVYTMIE
jgi:hypothetical protein